MIKKIMKSQLMKKTIIILMTFMILVNFVLPTYSHAASIWEQIGGALFKPIKFLVCAMGDAVINLLQSQFITNAPKAVSTGALSDAINSNYVPYAEHLKANGGTRTYHDTTTNKDVTIDFSNASDEDINHYISVVSGVYNSANNSKQDTLGTIGYGTSTYNGNADERTVSTMNKNAQNDIDKYNLNDEDKTYLENIRTATNDVYAHKLQVHIQFSPARIFSTGDKYGIPVFDVNFINPSTGSTAEQLQETISTWYTALRNIAVVGLLSVLVYVGIRIIISSTAGETAKYKSMLKDWLMAMCLLFFMHYMIALFIVSTEKITDFLVNTNVVADGTSQGMKDGDDVFMTTVRRRVGGIDENNSATEDDVGTEFAYTMIYIILIAYTLMFAWRYLKRVIYLAFLTMIAPMVALTYPLDKIKDGSAQAFNTWFKEYVFNVLIQPVHLILYTILISSAMNLVQKNALYAIVAIAFMLEAEKIVKSFFGMDKAQGGGMSSALTGGVMFAGAANLLGKGRQLLGGGGPRIPGTGGNSSGELDTAGSGGASGGSGDVGQNLREAFGIGQQQEEQQQEEQQQEEQQQEQQQSTTGHTPPAGLHDHYLRNGYYTQEELSALTSSNDPRNSANSNTGSLRGQFRERLSNARAVVGNVAGRSIRGAADVGKKFIANKENAKKLARLSARAIGAGTLGMIGAGFGLAGDKDSDILTYGAAGMLAGSSIGGNIANTASGIPQAAGNIRDTFERGYYGDEYYEKVGRDREIKRWEEDNNNQRHYKNRFGSSWKEAMDIDKEFRKYGITDQKDLDKVHDWHERNKGEFTIQQSAEIFKTANQISNIDTTKKEGREQVEKMLANQGITREADQDRIINGIEQLNGRRIIGDTGSSRVIQNEQQNNNNNSSNNNRNNNNGIPLGWNSHT